MKESKRKGVKSIVSPGNFTVVSLDGETYQVTSQHKEYAKIEALVKQQKWDQVFNILGKAKTIQVYTEGDIKVDGEQVTYKGKEIHGYAAAKLLAMVHEGISDYKPLARFLEKLEQCPHEKVKEHLYKFLEYGNIPLTADGDFLGYKRVRKDFMDLHTGEYDNSPGSVVKMRREDVTEDPSQGCSSGLHVGVQQYVNGFSGERTVIVKVDPRNVVSVPYDYGHKKMRTCEYYVVAEYDESKPLTSEVYHVTDEQQAKAQKKSAKVEKYISPIVKPLRGPDGRFIKKATVKGPVRDSKGRFVKRGS